VGSYKVSRDFKLQTPHLWREPTRSGLKFCGTVLTAREIPGLSFMRNTTCNVRSPNGTHSRLDRGPLRLRADGVQTVLSQRVTSARYGFLQRGFQQLVLKTLRA
jgi:hypothetical protein